MPSDYPDFEGPKSGLYDIPFWAAKEAVDKNFYVIGLDKVTLSTVTTSYTVPTGKTLYITHIGFYAAGTAAGDRNSNQMCQGLIYDHTLAAFIWAQGGNGGGCATFTKPFVFNAGETVTFYVNNYANHNCTLSVSAGGIEI